jgi:hypothetical protein
MLTSDFTQQLVKERMSLRLDEAAAHRLTRRRRARAWSWSSLAPHRQPDEVSAFNLRSC